MRSTKENTCSQNDKEELRCLIQKLGQKDVKIQIANYLLHLKDNYYEFRNKVADCLQLASEDLDDTEAFEEHYDEVMDLKESNDIMYHAFEAAYEIACGKIDTDDDFYSEYYSENDCMVMQSLHDKIVNMLKAIDLLAVSAGIN